MHWLLNSRKISGSRWSRMPVLTIYWLNYLTK
jgi:hypothetical protein